MRRYKIDQNDFSDLGLSIPLSSNGTESLLSKEIQYVFCRGAGLALGKDLCFSKYLHFVQVHCFFSEIQIFDFGSCKNRIDHGDGIIGISYCLTKSFCLTGKGIGNDHAGEFDLDQRPDFLPGCFRNLSAHNLANLITAGRSKLTAFFNGKAVGNAE